MHLRLRQCVLALAAIHCFVALAACQSRPIVEDLPYNGPAEPPHDMPPGAVDPKLVVIPPTPKDPVKSDVGMVIPRAAWTTSALDPRRMSPMNGVQRITFHHSGDGKPFLGESPLDVARHLETVRLFHKQRGMVDIGYHFAIDRAGRIWQLRSLKYEGQHVRIGRNGTRWNEHNIGIVVLGDFSKQPLTPAQKKTILDFARFLRTYYKVPVANVRTHGDLVDTDCPGTALKAYFDQLRRQGSL